MTRVLEPHLPRQVAQDTLRHTWEAYSGSLDHILANQRIVDLISQVRDIPILIIGSTQDVHAKREDLDRLQSQLNVKVKIVEGQHDFLLHEPHVAASAVEAFMTNIGRMT